MPIYNPDQGTGDVTPTYDPTYPAPTTGTAADQPMATAPDTSALSAMWEAAGHDPNKFYRAYVAANNLQATQTDPSVLQKIVDALNTVSPGIAAMDQVDSNGHLAGIILNGQKVQAVNGNNQWTDLVPWPAEGTGTGTVASMSIDPSYLAPFSQTFQSPDQAAIPSFQGPGEFQAPTADTILQDPSYQFRRDQAVDVLTKSKAAQGLFNSGGTVYDLGNLASNFAGQEYGNIYNRNLGKWGLDWQNALSKFGAQQGTSNEAYQRAVGQYQMARDLYFANQNNPFSKLQSVAQLGANSAAIAG